MKTIKLSLVAVLLFLLNACSNLDENQQLLMRNKDFQQAYLNLLNNAASRLQNHAIHIDQRVALSNGYYNLMHQDLLLLVLLTMITDQ